MSLLLTTPPTTTTLMEVREVREATLVTMAIIRSSWLIRAVSLLGGADMELGPEEGVGAISAGREGWRERRGSQKQLLQFLFLHPATVTHSRSSSYLETLVHQFQGPLCVDRAEEAVHQRRPSQ